MPVKQFQLTPFMAVSMILLSLNIIPVLQFFTTFSYLFHKVRTTFNIYLIAVFCGVAPVGLTIVMSEFYSERQEQVYEEQDNIFGFQVFLALMFPPAVSILSLYNISQIYSLCEESDACILEDQTLLKLVQNEKVYLLLIASGFQPCFWWILVQMMDIAEDRGNPYRLFQNEAKFVRCIVILLSCIEIKASKVLFFYTYLLGPGPGPGGH